MQFLSDLAAKLDRLMQFPLSGVLRPQLAANLRVIFHGDYGIYYLPGEKAVVVVRVLHGSRDVSEIADQGEFGV